MAVLQTFAKFAETLGSIRQSRSTAYNNDRDAWSVPLHTTVRTLQDIRHRRHQLLSRYVACLCPLASAHSKVLHVFTNTVGLFSGTTGAIHSLVGELTDETNQSIVFPLYDICSAVGFVIG